MTTPNLDLHVFFAAQMNDSMTLVLFLMRENITLIVFYIRLIPNVHNKT